MKSTVFISIVILFISCKNSKPIEIPFKYERHIYLKCVLNNGTKANLFFDTGAYGIYLDSTYNELSGFNYGSWPAISDANNVMSGEHRPLMFACSSLTYNPEFAYVINPRASFGKQCDGIVGWDFLDDHALKIDYLKKMITVIEPDELEIDDSYKEIPLEFENNRLYVNVEITISKNLKIKGKFVFDTGFGGSVVLTGETTRKYQIDTIANEKVQFLLDWRVVDKLRSTGFVTRGRSIKLEDFELAEPIIEYYKDETGVLAKGEYIGLIGNRFFEHFDVILDLKNKTLFLKPNADCKKRMRFRDIGIEFVDRTDICEGLIVNLISLNSKADKEGIKFGDIITHFDGQPVKNNSEKMIKELYDNIGKETLITFKRKDSVFKLNLKMEEMLVK